MTIRVPGLHKARRAFELTRARFLNNRWGRLIANVVQETGRDDAPGMAAMIAYYTLLSLFPLLLGVIALLGLFLPSEAVQQQLFDFFERNLPGATDVLLRNIRTVIELRGTLGVLSLIGLFWSGSVIFGVVRRVMNRAWAIERYRPFYLRKALDLGLALGTSILFFVSLGTTTVSAVLSETGAPVLRTLVLIAAPVLALVVNFIIFLLIYRFMPNARIAWRDVWPGALLAAVLFETAKSLFAFYLSRFASYQVVYGPLASVIIFLVWIYVSALILILGAEFASELARTRARESGPPALETMLPLE